MSAENPKPQEQQTNDEKYSQFGDKTAMDLIAAYHLSAVSLACLTPIAFVKGWRVAIMDTILHNAEMQKSSSPKNYSGGKKDGA